MAYVHNYENIVISYTVLPKLLQKLHFVYTEYYSMLVFNPSAMKISRHTIRALSKSARSLSKGYRLY